MNSLGGLSSGPTPATPVDMQGQGLSAPAAGSLPPIGPQTQFDSLLPPGTPDGNGALVAPAVSQPNATASPGASLPEGLANSGPAAPEPAPAPSVLGSMVTQSPAGKATGEPGGRSHGHGGRFKTAQKDHTNEQPTDSVPDPSSDAMAEQALAMPTFPPVTQVIQMATLPIDSPASGDVPVDDLSNGQAGEAPAGGDDALLTQTVMMLPPLAKSIRAATQKASVLTADVAKSDAVAGDPAKAWNRDGDVKQNDLDEKNGPLNHFKTPVTLSRNAVQQSANTSLPKAAVTDDSKDKAGQKDSQSSTAEIAFTTGSVSSDSQSGQPDLLQPSLKQGLAEFQKPLGTAVAMQPRAMREFETSTPNDTQTPAVTASAPRASKDSPATDAKALMHDGGETKTESGGDGIVFQPKVDFAGGNQNAQGKEGAQQSSHAAEAATVVKQTFEAVEHMKSDGRTNVELQVKLRDGMDVTIKLQWKDGSIQAMFKTGSTELCNAIQQGWSQFSSQASERGVTVSAPVFESNSFQSGGNGSNQRNDPQQNPEHPWTGETSDHPSQSRTSNGNGQRRSFDAAQPQTTSSMALYA